VRTTTGNTFLELRLTRAYIRLLFVPEGDDGARTVTLARFGQQEVRMIELSDASRANTAPLWIELFDHDDRRSIDSCACHELEEAVQAAEQLMRRASQVAGTSSRNCDARDLAPGNVLRPDDNGGLHFSGCR
jgi:hypothetical protein